MSEIADFLRARYTAARKAEAGRRSVPGNLPFEWQWRRELDEEWIEIGSARIPLNDFVQQYGEPAADSAVIADLDAKLALVDLCTTFLHDHEGGTDPCAEGALRILAQPFAGQSGHKGEEWAP